MEPRTIDLAKEVDRLTDEMQQWAERQADAPFASDASRRMEYEGETTQRLRNGVVWAESEFGSVELRPITDGLRRAIVDLTDETAYTRDQCLVAVGTLEAPYVAHDPDELTPSSDELRETLANITDLHPAYVDWASGRITDLGSMDGDMGNSYQDMLLEMRTAKANHETTGSDTAE